MDPFDPTPEGPRSSQNVDDESDEDLREVQEPPVPNEIPSGNRGTRIPEPERRPLSNSKSNDEPERNVRRRLDLSPRGYLSPRGRMNIYLSTFNPDDMDTAQAAYFSHLHEEERERFRGAHYSPMFTLTEDSLDP